MDSHGSRNRELENANIDSIDNVRWSSRRPEESSAIPYRSSALLTLEKYKSVYIYREIHARTFGSGDGCMSSETTFVSNSMANAGPSQKSVVHDLMDDV